jgi:hypothetical protein
MDKSLLDPMSQSNSLASQPDRRRQGERRAGSGGGRRTADFEEPGLGVGSISSPEGLARYTWVHDQDTLEAVYVN